MRKGKLVFNEFMIPKTREALGGARPFVQKSAEGAIQAPTPMLASRIYAAPSLELATDDPRYPGKANNVENIYHPAPPEITRVQRSGFAQAFNWLFTGRME